MYSMHKIRIKYMLLVASVTKEQYAEHKEQLDKIKTFNVMSDILNDLGIEIDKMDYYLESLYDYFENMKGIVNVELDGEPPKNSPLVVEGVGSLQGKNYYSIREVYFTIVVHTQSKDECESVAPMLMSDLCMGGKVFVPENTTIGSINCQLIEVAEDNEVN